MLRSRLPIEWWQSWRQQTSIEGIAEPTSISAEVLSSVSARSWSHVLLEDLVSGEQTTAGEFLNKVASTALALRSLGVQSRQVVGFQSPNSLDYPAILHALALLGAITSPVSSDLVQQDTAWQLHNCRAHVHLFADAAKTSAGHDSPKGVSIAELVEQRATLTEQLFRSTTSLATSRAAAKRLLLPAAAADKGIDDDEWRDPHSRCSTIIRHLLAGHTDSSAEVLRPFSSGTSGTPHGVRLSHRNLLWNLIQVSSAEQLSQQDVLLGVVPFWHSYGLCMVMNAALYAGARVLVAPSFNLHQCLRALRDCQVTRAHLAPPILEAFVRYPDLVRKSGPFPRLTDLFSGGAQLSSTAEDRLQRLFGPAVRIRQGYGLTEASPATHMVPHHLADESPSPSGSIGLLLPNTEARLVCPNTNAVVDIPNCAGELRVRGPQVMLGYLGEASSSDGSFDELGFLKTGDLATYDENGFFFVVERLKDIIKHRGHSISPSELEALLAQHPSVSESAVVGLPVQEGNDDEMPAAFVVVAGEKTEEELTQLRSDILDFAAQRCAPWKRIRQLFFLPALPRNSTGKVLKFLLKQQTLEMQLSKP